MKNFWDKLNKPIFILAPMANVTDAAFRRLIAKYSDHGGQFTRQSAKRVGGPDVFWTEFVSADGLCSRGRDQLLVDFMYTKKEKPIVAQLFGANPEKMKEACALAASLGFDGIDINMGCPDRTIEKQGAGAATIKNPQLAKEIIRAAREGAPNLPVSVKTRIGYNKNEIETWIPELLKEKLAALTVHLRTRKEMSDAPAHWDLMPQIVKLRDEIAPETLIIGNGDVTDIKDGKNKIHETGCDGVMLGRAIFGNPWLFSGHIPTVEEKLKVMTEHTKLFEKLFKGIKNFAVMKKHYKAYSTGFDGAKDLRIKLMETTSAKEVERVVKDFLKNK